MKAEKDRYQKVLDLTLTLSKERLGEELVALYLGGSYLRGDFIPGWSDIDITAIVKDEVWKNESLKRQFFEKCKTICKDVESAYSGIEIGLGNLFGTTSESIASRATNLASFFLRKEKLIFGRDVLKEAPPINLDKIPEMGKAATLWICDDLLKILQPKETLDKRNLIRLARGANTYVMKIAQNSLFMKGIVKLQKKKMVDTFEREYASFKLKKVVREAYELQLTWQEAKMDSKRLTDFIGTAKEFAQDLKKILV